VRDVNDLTALDENDTNFAVVTRGIKPKLRGIPDVIAVMFAVPGAALLIGSARPGLATSGAMLYGVTLVLLFAISATYHTPHWPLHIRRIWRKLDHSAIYILIAGCYTPVFQLLIPEATFIVPAIWTVTALGVLKSFVWEKSPRSLNTIVYVAVSYVVLAYVPELHERASPLAFWMWVAGGVWFSIGAVVYVKRWPNPAPQYFGYHEIFHVFVVGGCASHFVSFWSILT
jgi:hemolysin III